MEVDVNLEAPGRPERRLVSSITRLIWRPRRAVRREVPPWLPCEEFRLLTPDGAKLSARWFPARDPIGTVVLAHPDRRYGQDWFLIDGWIDFLHDRGFDLLTFDFVGYGESRGGDNYHHEHLIAACQEARGRSPDGPLHLVGVSLGAFVAINAAVHLDFVESLILESPYPSLADWYEGRVLGRVLRGFVRAFPKSSRLVNAEQNAPNLKVPRILIAASRNDATTPIALTRRVAAAAPDHARILELDRPGHLDLFGQSRAYREAIEQTLLPASESRMRSEPTPITRARPRTSALLMPAA